MRSGEKGDRGGQSPPPLIFPFMVYPQHKRKFETQYGYLLSNDPRMTQKKADSILREQREIEAEMKWMIKNTKKERRTMKWKDK